LALSLALEGSSRKYEKAVAAAICNVCREMAVVEVQNTARPPRGRVLLDSSLSIHFKQVDSGNTCTAYNQWMFRNVKQSNAHGEIRILCPERKVCTY